MVLKKIFFRISFYNGKADTYILLFLHQMIRFRFKYCIFLLLIFVFSYSGIAQVKEIGNPYIRNYPRKITQAGQQNWMIEQGADDLMYFANNEGLLEFNGFDWVVHALPNRSVVRSLKYQNQKIYVGGFNEIGYFSRQDNGKLKYTSFLSKIPEEYADFGDVWKIYMIDNQIIFQSFKFIFYFVNGELERIIAAPDNFHFSFEVDGELYVNDLKMGLFRVAPERLVPVYGVDFLKGKEIWAMEAIEDGILIATADEGLFLYKNFQLQVLKTPASNYLKSNQIYSFTRLKDKKLAFGTVQNGLLICSERGEIIKILNRKNGLQNNTVLSLKQDRFENLWLGLDNGIDYLEINSPFSYFGLADGLSAGYASADYKGALYLGTNQGVFYKSWDKLTNEEKFEEFALIDGTRGQVWSLGKFDDQLICGHNKGFLQIENGKARVICNNPGGWLLKAVPNKPDLLLGGTYGGFILLEKKNGKWSYGGQVKGFTESARVFEWENDSTLWMSHGLKGVYKLIFNDTYTSIVQAALYGKNKGLPSNFSLEINLLDGQIVVASTSGIYTYNSLDDKFYYNQELTSKFNGFMPLKIFEDKKKNVWFFTENNLGVLRMQEDGSQILISTPFTSISNSYINGFQYLNPINETNILFGSDIGFIHYNPGKLKKYDYTFNTFIDKVDFIKADSVLSQTNITSIDLTKNPFENRQNHFVFSFVATDYENSDHLLYSTKLEGYSDGWDAWSPQRTREYTNLKYGAYTFKVRSKNGYNSIGNEAKFSFVINPPWFRTWWAFILYGFTFVLLALLLYYLIKRQANVLKRKEKIEQLRIRRQNENRMKREKLQAEKELIRIKNEQLRAEMISKDKELANSTLQMIQKNKLLNRLKVELDKMNSKTSDELIQNQNQALIRRINREIEDKNQWRVFEEHFEAVHETFLKKIKTEFPDLTPRELKLAAYLRLNISTKEIALLMNISTRGVEVARYRLRKKFKLKRDQSLLDFILNY